MDEFARLSALGPVQMDLFAAAESGDERAAAEALAAGADPNFMILGFTPLSLAAHRGRLGPLLAMLSCGRARTDIADKEGNAPLMLAAKNGHGACAEALAGHSDLLARNAQGKRASDLAREAGCMELAGRLAARELAQEEKRLLAARSSAGAQRSGPAGHRV